MILDPASQRVLGALMEKEMTTPELYPLSVNALLAACNQKSSREPVMQLSEEEVRAALDSLAVQDLVSSSRDSRVVRFEHRIRTVLQLRRDETAMICLLLLRGAQTPGELRSRSDRMFSFDDLSQVQGTLERLASRPDPLASALARAPGSREVRWIHLLGKVDGNLRPALSEETVEPDEVARLMAQLRALEGRVRRLEEWTGVQTPGETLPDRSDDTA